MATNDKPTLRASGRSARGNQLEISGQWQITISHLAAREFRVQVRKAGVRRPTR